MERPERPSRHKLNRIKFRPTFSSDSESEVNDNDGSISITFCESQGEGTSLAGPSTSSSVQLLGQTNADNTSTTNSHRSFTTPVMFINRIDSRGEPQSHMETLRRKRSSATSSLASAAHLDAAADGIYNPSTSTTGPSSSPERSHRSDFMIRPRSFCHINNTLPHSSAFKFKRVGGPIDLTPTSSNRDSSSSTSSSVQPEHSSHADIGIIKKMHIHRLRNESATNSAILRHFDDVWHTPFRKRARLFANNNLRETVQDTSSTLEEPPSSSSTVPRNSSSLDDYCDLVNNYFFVPTADSSGQRSAEREGPSEPQSSSTTDIINRHISTTPDLINHQTSSMINDLESYLDRQVRIDGGTEPIDHSSDDVIVVESLDPEFIVPSSRSPSPIIPMPSSPIPLPDPLPQSKSDKAQSSQSKDVPITLQELNQSLVSLLECPVCLDHATPPIYQCCKGHILCRSCHPRLTTCPICRSRLPGDRNSVMEKVAEKLMYPCKNTVTGCSQMLKLDDKQKHEEGCGFRHYTCIITECHWKGYKPELVVHLQSNHPDKLITGSVKELHVPVPTAVPEGGPSLITHHWIQSAHNEVFIVTFLIDLYKRIMKGCVVYIGSPENADKFTYVFELKQLVSPFRRLSYSRTTHADTIKTGQPLCLNSDFSINIDIARLYHDYTTNIIPVHISIQQENE